MKLLSKKLSLIVIILAAFLTQSCQDDNRLTLNFDEAPPPFNTSQAVRDTTIAENVNVFIIKEGEGPFQVVAKDLIDVRITGRTEAGQIFDSSFSNLSPATERLIPNLTPVRVQRAVCVSRRNPQGSCAVLVEGLRKSLLGMKEGEKRTIVVPPNKGFTEDYVNLTGQIGENGFDLRDQTITYDVELVTIR